MKRISFLVLCMVLFFSCVGCGSDEPEMTVRTGCYYLAGDYEEYATPYLWLYTEDQTFYHGAGTIFSYAEYGSYEIEGNKLIATSQNTTFVFEIQDENILIVVDNGDSGAFQPPKDGKFVYSEN